MSSASWRVHKVRAALEKARDFHSSLCKMESEVLETSATRSGMSDLFLSSWRTARSESPSSTPAWV